MLGPSATELSRMMGFPDEDLVDGEDVVDLIVGKLKAHVFALSPDWAAPFPRTADWEPGPEQASVRRVERKKLQKKSVSANGATGARMESYSWIGWKDATHIFNTEPAH